MYLYDDIDQQLVEQRVAQFKDQTRRFLGGELSEEEFRPLRLQNGLYILVNDLSPAAFSRQVEQHWHSIRGGEMTLGEADVADIAMQRRFEESIVRMQVGNQCLCKRTQQGSGPRCAATRPGNARRCARPVRVPMR